jgi:hypothetical protein
MNPVQLDLFPAEPEPILTCSFGSDWLTACGLSGPCAKCLAYADALGAEAA